MNNISYNKKLEIAPELLCFDTKLKVKAGKGEKKARLTIADFSTHIAMQDASKKPHFLDRFRCVQVQVIDARGQIETIQLNRMSLYKRTNLAFLRLFANDLKLEEIKKEAEEVQETSKHLDALKEDAGSISLLSRVGIAFKRGENYYFSESVTSGLRVRAFTKENEIGTGSCGVVSKVKMLGISTLKSHPPMVVKMTIRPEYEEIMREEYWMHRSLWDMEGVRGIQKPPHVLIDTGSETGYLVSEYAYDLESLTAYAKKDRKILNGDELLASSQSLLEGLDFLHSVNVVHGDIKPLNCCAESDDSGKVTFKIADFGGARSIEDINLEDVLGIYTPEFVSDGDMKKIQRVEAEYQLSQNDELALIKARIFGDILYRLINMSYPRRVALQLAGDWMDTLNINGLTKSSCRSEEILRKEAASICRKQDVYALGQTLEEIFDSQVLLSPEKRKAIDKLIGDMKKENHEERITATEALKRYNQILNLPLN